MSLDIPEDGVIVALPEDGVIIVALQEGVIVAPPEDGVIVALPEAGVIVIHLVAGAGVIVVLPEDGVIVALHVAGDGVIVALDSCYPPSSSLIGCFLGNSLISCLHIGRLDSSSFINGDLGILNLSHKLQLAAGFSNSTTMSAVSTASAFLAAALSTVAASSAAA